MSLLYVTVLKEILQTRTSKNFNTKPMLSEDTWQIYDRLIGTLNMKVKLTWIYVFFFNNWMLPRSVDLK